MQKGGGSEREEGGGVGEREKRGWGEVRRERVEGWGGGLGAHKMNVIKK